MQVARLKAYDSTSRVGIFDNWMAIEVVINKRAQNNERGSLNGSSFAEELKRADIILFLEGTDRLKEENNYSQYSKSFLQIYT